MRIALPESMSDAAFSRDLLRSDFAPQLKFDFIDEKPEKKICMSLVIHLEERIAVVVCMLLKIQHTKV